MKLEKIRDIGFWINEGIEMLVSMSVVGLVATQFPVISPERQFIGNNFFLVTAGIYLGAKPLRYALGKALEYFYGVDEDAR